MDFLGEDIIPANDLLMGQINSRSKDWSRWEYILCDTASRMMIDPLRGTHDRTLEVDLNKSGSASGWISTSQEIAGLIWPWSTYLSIIYKDDDHVSHLYWSGPINSRDIDMAAGRVSFTAVGWFERLMKLNLQQEQLVDGQLVFDEMDAAWIVTILLEKARELDPRIPIWAGTMYVTQLRTITYTVDQNIGQAILDLMNLEAGFDWYIDPQTFLFHLRPRVGQVKPDVKWTFLADRKSEHSNLANCVEHVDGSTLVNDIRPRGRYGSGLATSVESQAKYGVFMESPSLSDVVDSNILNAYANAEIVYRSEPRVTYTMTPKPNSDAKVPKLFRDFQIGDTTFLTARKDFINVVDQPTRIFGATLSISDRGVETLTNVQTTAS